MQYAVQNLDVFALDFFERKWLDGSTEWVGAPVQGRLSLGT